MIIRSSVGKPFLNSKTLSELCKPSYSLHNAHSKPKIGESVNFEITLKLNTSVSELQTFRKPAQNKSTQHTKWNKRVKFENRSHNALWSCIFSEVQKLVDVSLPNSKWKQRVRVLTQNMLVKHGWFLTKNKENATARVFLLNSLSFACCELRRTERTVNRLVHSMTKVPLSKQIRLGFPFLYKSTSSAFCLGEWLFTNCSKPNCASEDSLNKTWVLFLSPSRSNWSTLADPSLLSQFTNTFVSYLDTIPVQFLCWPEKRVEKSPNTFGLVCTLFLVTTRAFSDRFQL